MLTPDFNERVIPFALHPLGILDVFVELGFAVPDLLQQTGISPDQITQKQLKISYLQLMRIIENAIALSSLPSLGLLVGKSIAWHAHGTVGSVVYSSPSLIDAYLAFRRYLQIAQPIYKLFFSTPDYYFDRGNFLVSRLHTLVDPVLSPALARFELEFRFAVLARLYRACGNPGVADTHIEIGVSYFPDGYTELLLDLPVAQVKFNCPYSYIAVHRDFFFLPWRGLRRPLFETLIDQCEEEFQANSNVSISEQLEWLIYKNYASDLSLQDAADLLRISPRALARRLACENSSFRLIQNQIRAKRVSCHLKYSRLPQEDIAILLGFSCAASLRRAARARGAQGITLE